MPPHACSKIVTVLYVFVIDCKSSYHCLPIPPDGGWECRWLLAVVLSSLYRR